MRRLYALSIVAALLCFSTASALIGQGTQDSGTGNLVYIASQPVKCTPSEEPKELKDLEAAYAKGDWTDTRLKLNALIKVVRSTCQLDLLDKNGVGVYLVSFLRTEEAAQPAIVRLAAPAANDMSYQPYNARLIPRTAPPLIFDIRFTPGLIPIATAYNGTPLPNPLAGSLSKFVSTVVSGIGKSPLLPFTDLKPLINKAGEGSVLTVNRLMIPDGWSRFSLSVQDKALPNSDPKAPKIDPLTTKYTYGPGTRWDLGLGAAFPVTTFGNKPVKVDSSKALASDQPTGLLTYAAAYWHWTPYDETAPVATTAEQNKVFVGIALTPDPGLVLGYAWSPAALRSISIHIGGGALLANVLQSGDHIGSEPTRAGHPTRRGALGVAFLGLGYSL
jgi:hypothetical protein